jgi:ubiquinone/menaquinone biosynthesis C-methylase UbiE
MHAVTMSKLVNLLHERKDKDQVSMLDVGCGTGYSTILYADLAS